MYAVSEPELNDLVSGYSSVNLALFGISFGAALSFGIALLTTHAVASDRVFASFVALLAVSLGLSLFFGWRAIVDRQAADRRIRQIVSNRQRTL